MFEKFTNKIVNGATKIAKKELNMVIENKTTALLGVATMCFTILAIMEPKKEKATETTNIVINNYYIISR